jgi:hypothetical protein
MSRLQTRVGLQRRTFKIRFPRIQTQIRNKLWEKPRAGEPASRRVSEQVLWRPTLLRQLCPVVQLWELGSGRSKTWPRTHSELQAANSSPGLLRFTPNLFTAFLIFPLHQIATHERGGPAPEATGVRTSPVWKGSLCAPFFPFSGALVCPICTHGCQSDLPSGTWTEPDWMTPGPWLQIPEPGKGVPCLPGPPSQLVTYLPPR